MTGGVLTNTAAGSGSGLLRPSYGGDALVWQFLLNDAVMTRTSRRSRNESTRPGHNAPAS